MSVEHTPEDAQLWIEEAQARLEHAEQHVQNRDGRIYCEQAHYAAEMAIKAVIILEPLAKLLGLAAWRSPQFSW